MVTGEVRIEPQMFAACVKQFRRCAPIVVPGLPPTGAAGVASLKPSPAPSRLMITIVAEANAEEAIEASSAVARSRERVERGRRLTCPPIPCRARAGAPAPGHA